MHDRARFLDLIFNPVYAHTVSYQIWYHNALWTKLFSCLMYNVYIHTISVSYYT